VELPWLKEHCRSFSHFDVFFLLFSQDVNITTLKNHKIRLSGTKNSLNNVMSSFPVNLLVLDPSSM